jgi:hypothetical protein
MKNSKRCPKCQSTDIVKIPGDVGAYGAGNNIKVGWTVFNAVKVARYLCAACGFTEEWIQLAEDIAKIKKRYAPATG